MGEVGFETAAEGEGSERQRGVGKKEEEVVGCGVEDGLGRGGDWRVCVSEGLCYDNTFN